MPPPIRTKTEAGPENSNGKLYYHVRIGPVPTSTVAEKLLTQLKDFKLDKAKVITYN